MRNYLIGIAHYHCVIGALNWFRNGISTLTSVHVKNCVLVHITLFPKLASVVGVEPDNLNLERVTC